MNKFLLAAVAIPAMALASDASAQTNFNAGGGASVQNRIVNLEARIDAGIQAGVIDRTEARNLRRQTRDLRQLEMSYSQNGLTRQERQALQQRIRSLRDQVRLAGGEGWGNRYGWNDEDFDRQAYGQAYGNSGYTTDRYGNRIPVQTYTTDRYGNRVPVQTYATDRYGNRVQEGYSGQGGPYLPAPNTSAQGVLGGLLGNGSGGFRIGDLISGVLGGSLGGASNYGYRDRSDVYFRSDGRQVYEIDARTNTVIRVHPIR
jgi:hypothetical protein